LTDTILFKKIKSKTYLDWYTTNVAGVMVKESLPHSNGWRRTAKSELFYVSYS